MSAFAKYTLLLTVVGLIPQSSWAAEGVPIPFTDLASAEKWIDGPDAVQPSNDPRSSDSAVANDGTRIHVWESFGTDRLDIIFRLFDADGSPLNDPTRVNTTVDDEQQSPRVAVSADGSFLVIFTNVETPPGETFPQKMVRSQAYNANGDPVGVEQLVSTVPTKEQTNVYADVAALRTADGSPGGYAVVWRNSDFTPEWGDIHASIVNSAGVPSAEFNVHSDDSAIERYSSVTELHDGGFLVVWGDHNGVRGRRFNSAGGAMGLEFKIDTLPTGNPGGNTDVALGWDGRVLVVWEDSGTEVPPLPIAQGPEIRGRMFQFDASGNDLDPLGEDFRINNLFTGIQNEPRIAEFGAVGFLVIWGSDPGGAGSDMNQSVEARVVSGNNAFDANGDGADDNQEQFNIWDNNDGQNLLGAHGWYGRLATSWQSQSWDGEPEPDTINQLVITGRDIEYCMFCDDFEWYSPASPGSLWRWDATAGVVP